MDRSTAHTKSARTGPKPTKAEPEARLRELLAEVRRYGLRVKADYSRANAEIVAMAASLQLISTKVGKNSFAQAWQITTKGLTYINEKDHS